jgi:hypothetical protein
LNSAYSTYTNIEPTITGKGIGQIKDDITNAINAQTNITNVKTKYDLRVIIYTLFSLNSKDGDTMKNYWHNYTNLSLSDNYGGAETYFKKNYICKTEGSTQKAFATFTSINDHINFIIAKIYQKVQANNDITNTQSTSTFYPTYVAKFIVDNWPLEQVGTWDKLSETVQSQYINKVVETINYFGNNEQPLTIPQLQELLNPVFSYEAQTSLGGVNNSQNVFTRLKISLIPTTTDKRKIFTTSLQVSTNTTANCNGGGNYNLSTQYVSNDLQEFSMTFNEIFQVLACDGEPISDQVGKYYMKFTMYSTPIKSDGTPDSTRSDFYENFDLNFEYTLAGLPILL